MLILLYTKLSIVWKNLKGERLLYISKIRKNSWNRTQYETEERKTFVSRTYTKNGKIQKDKVTKILLRILQYIHLRYEIKKISYSDVKTHKKYENKKLWK